MTDFVLRAPHDSDAADIADLFNQPKVIEGTLRLPFTPEEGVEKFLAGIGPNKRLIIAEAEERAVGFILLRRFDGRMAHSGDVFIAVHDAWHGRGLGAALMMAALDVADNWMGLVRVQLEVMAGNDAAIHLYQRLGFQTEGRARAGTLVNGELVDHFFMARLRPAPERREADRQENP